MKHVSVCSVSVECKRVWCNCFKNPFSGLWSQDIQQQLGNNGSSTVCSFVTKGIQEPQFQESIKECNDDRSIYASDSARGLVVSRYQPLPFLAAAADCSACLLSLAFGWGDLALFANTNEKILTSGIYARPVYLPCLASSGLHLSLFLSLHSDPKRSHSAVHPPWRWKTGLLPPNPPPDCFSNTPLVKRVREPRLFCVCLYCAFHLFLSFLRHLSNFYASTRDKQSYPWVCLSYAKIEKNTVSLRTASLKQMILANSH